MKVFISPGFWNDPDVENLTSGQKLAILWLWTNPKTNHCGFCEVSPKRFTFDTGLPIEDLFSATEALPRAFKRFGNIIYSRKFIRHQYGSGEQLTRNNIFKSVLNAFGGISVVELKAAIVDDYPEIAASVEALTKPLPSPSSDSESALKHKGKEGKGKEGLGDDQGESAERGKEPEGWPSTEGACRSQAVSMGVDPDYAAAVWNDHDSTGDFTKSDGSGHRTQILKWSGYLKSRWTHKQNKNHEAHALEETKAQLRKPNGNMPPRNPSRGDNFLH